MILSLFFRLVIFLLIAVRFVNINQLPVFLDEATYLQFAQQIKNSPSNLLVSFPAAVLPVMVWSLSVLYKLFEPVANMLTVGRLLLASCDVMAAYVVFLIGKELLNKKYAYISLIIYLLLPLNLFHSRIILLEPMTNFFLLLALYFFIKFQGTLVKQILLVSFSLALSYLTKPLAIVSLGSIIFFPLNNHRKIISILLILIIFAILVLPFSLMIYSRFSDYHVNLNSNAAYLLTHFKLNLWRAYWWMKAYLTLPIIFSVLITLVLGSIKKSRLIIWLGLWFFSILIIESFVGTNFFPRHLYPIAAPVSLIVGFFIFAVSEKSNKFAAIAGSLLMIACLKNDLLILYNPQFAPLALEDKQQFYEDWPSGVGLKEIGAYISQASTVNKLNIFIEDDSLLSWALPNLYLHQNVNLIRLKYPLISNSIDKNSYIILNRSQEAPEEWQFTKVFSYPKGPHRYINIYKS